MSSIRAVAREVRTVLSDGAEQAARASGCVRRQRQFSGATLVQTLVFGWLANVAATLEDLARMAAMRGVRVSAQAVDQRFTPALATCLLQVLEQLVRTVIVSEPVVSPLLARFNGVYVLDSTTISLPAALAAQWPGCGGNAGQGRAALKGVVCLELSQGGLVGPDLLAGRASDRTSAAQHATLPAQSLRLADLGFFSTAVLARIAAAGSFFLTRWQANTALADPDGRRWADIAAELRRRGEASVDVPIVLGARERLPARLLAVRVCQAEADRRRRQLKRRAQRAGYTARTSSLALADWTILLTNVPPERLALEEALVLARARWQIELLFKRWKADAAFTAWRSAQPWRTLCEVYAKLIGCVVQHWVLVVGCWTVPDRSLAKAAQVVRQHARGLAQAFDQHEGLVAALQRLVAALAVGCRLTRRKQRPSTAQLLRNPRCGGLT